MKHKTVLLVALGLMIMAQLFVPFKMIWDRQKVTTEGTAFKFRTAPIDPIDPFRGKYITLSYRNTKVTLDSNEYWSYNESAFAEIAQGTEGYAYVKGVYHDPPSHTEDYVALTVDGCTFRETEMTVNFPFDRYYMEESKAYDAELAYRASRQDSSSQAYALVYIRQGAAVLDNVFIDEIPIKELVEKDTLE